MQEKVSITVPAEHGGRFRGEAAFTLRHAAEELEDTLRFARKGKREPVGHVELSLLGENLDHARDVFAQVSESPESPEWLEVSGQYATVRSTLEGCLADAVDDLKGACEQSGDERGLRAVRFVLEELNLWLELMERVDRIKLQEEVDREQEQIAAEEGSR